MHESRMIAEVVPPGCCAIENVRGSRMATPFAPPKPGSTPMMIPRMTPTNMSSRLSGDSATPNPCSSALTSSTRASLSRREHRRANPPARRSIESQCSLLRHCGKGHREPYFEDQEKCDADAYRDRRDFDPGVLAQVPHEVGDIERGRDVEPQICDQRDIHDRRHENRQYFLQLIARHERLGSERRVSQGTDKDRCAGGADEQADIEGKIAGLRPVLSPSGTQAVAVEYDQGAEQEYDGGDPDFNRLDRCRRTLLLAFHPLLDPPVPQSGVCGRVGCVPLASTRSYLARKPACFMSMMCRASSRATQASYSFPLKVVWLNAPVSRKLFQSGVSRTFFSMYT